MFMQEENSACW